MNTTRNSYFKFFGILFILSLPLLGLIGLIINRNTITPNDQFFSIIKGEIPQINEASWNLTIDGYVENKLYFDYYNFTSQPAKEVLATLACVEGPSGTALWKGVSLKALLVMADLKPGAVDVIFWAADNFSSSLTIEQATAENVMLAYEMNGEILPANQGYPLILVAPNHWGYKWVKWIVRLEVVNYDHFGFWESRGWDDDALRTPLADWILHAVLFSLAFIFGGLSIVSGLKRSPITESFRDLPKFVNRKFHLANSLAYLICSFLSFLYWIGITYLNRGAIFYTFHGVLALGSIILAVPATITGFKKVKKRDSRKRTWHYRWTLASYLLFLITILTGFLLSFTGQFRIY